MEAATRVGRGSVHRTAFASKSFEGRSPRTRSTWADHRLAGATSVHGAGGGSMTAGATAPAIVFRAKGLLHIAGSERAHALQAVHETYELVEAHAWPDGDERLNRLVFIGHGLREGELRAALAACRAA